MTGCDLTLGNAEATRRQIFLWRYTYRTERCFFALISRDLLARARFEYLLCNNNNAIGVACLPPTHPPPVSAEFFDAAGLHQAES